MTRGIFSLKEASLVESTSPSNSVFSSKCVIEDLTSFSIGNHLLGEFFLDVSAYVDETGELLSKVELG